MKAQTFDIHFNDSENSNSKGFKDSYEFCKIYIDSKKNIDDSLFKSYKGGTVSIVCNETSEVVFEEEIN